MSSADEPPQVPSHHIKQDYCENRENYRKGKRLTAVKVYTINDESTYLIISRIQAINLSEELLKLVSSYGSVKKFHKLDEYPTEAFEEAYLVQYSDITKAKKAKRKLDEKDFYGSMLHVFYAPEYETPEEVVKKLKERSRSVVNRIKYLKREANKMEQKKQQTTNKKQQQQQRGESSAGVDNQGRWQGNYQSDVINIPVRSQVAGPSQFPPSNKRKQMNYGTNNKRARYETSPLPSTFHHNINNIPQQTANVCDFVPRNVNLKSLKKN